MASLYEVSAEAQNDLFEIWQRIALDSTELADRIDTEFRELFAALGKMPRQGHTRKDLTLRPVLFFPLYSFLVVYQPDVKPVRIIDGPERKDVGQICAGDCEGAGAGAGGNKKLVEGDFLARVQSDGMTRGI